MKTLLDHVGAKNLKIAASTAVLTHEGASVDAAPTLRGRLGLWLVASTQGDTDSDFRDAHRPIHRAPDFEAVARWVAMVPDAPVVSDALLTDPDDEYLEAKALDRLRAATRHPTRP
jgi:hypothetical protein